MLRAARPMVWISERRRAQEAFLVGVEDRDQRHLGDVEALAQQVDADQHVELAQPQVADDLDALDRVDVGVQVAHLDAVLVQVLGRGPRPCAWSASVTSTRSLFFAQSLASRRAGRRPASSTGRMITVGSIRPVGRTTCSTKLPCVRSISYGPAWPRRRSSAARSASNSSNFSGRLSSADGRRKPYSTSVSLARAVAAVHAAELRDRDVALVDDQQRVLGQVVDQRRRRLARLAAGEVARVVLDALAEADALHHLEVEARALLEPLRLDQLAGAGRTRRAARAARP